MRLVGLCFGACLGLGLGGAGYFLAPSSGPVTGVRVAGAPVPAADPATWVVDVARAELERTVRLEADDVVADESLSSLGGAVDVEATLAAARAVGHEGSLFRRLREARAARGGAVDLPLVLRFDPAIARARLVALAERVARAPVDAHVDLSVPAKVPDVPGRSLDVEGSLEVVLTALPDRPEAIRLVVAETPARITLAELVAVDVSKVLSSYETKFATFGTGRGRSANIRRAASLIDGHILAPGQVFSFNDVVGPRSLENGFTLAPEIQGDELQTGVGGGTCQVSSTLYAAALFGALGILERQGHSRPSSYTKLGLDATVFYPSTDLRIENTMSFPIMIHAFLPEPTKIRVELLGGDPVATVVYAYGVGGTEDFVRRVTVKPGLPEGKRVLRQKGTRGMDVTSSVTVKYLDGRVEERHYFTGYRPAPEVYWVPPGYDETALPPLPPHAKGVEAKLRAEEVYGAAM